MILNPPNSIEETIQANSIEAFKIIIEKGDKSRKSSKKGSYLEKKSSSLEKNVDDFCSLTKEQMLEKVKNWII